VRDTDARRILQHIFDVHARDHVNAWDLTSAGAYTRRTPSPDAPEATPESIGTFETLMREARQQAT
jgi:polyphosphate kinase